VISLVADGTDVVHNVGKCDVVGRKDDDIKVVDTTELISR